MAISTEEKYLLNIMNATASKVQLGTLIQNAESVVASEIALAYGKLLVGNASGIATAATLTSAQFLLGDGSSHAVAVSMSGDATMSNAGAVTIANTAVSAAKLAADAVTTVKILNANVTLAKLAAGITPSHVVKYAGKFTTAGGAAAEDQTLSGVLATDVVVYSLQDKGVTPRTILTGKPGTDKITWTFSGDPSTDHVVSYQVLRAAS